MKVLLTGLSGSGKSTLAKELLSVLSEFFSVAYLNGDIIRALYGDWDFSAIGRLHQANRVALLSSQVDDDIILMDFIAPTNEIRAIVNPDITIYMDTVASSQYHDTDSIFESPIKPDVTLSSFPTSFDFDYIIGVICAKRKSQVS